MAEFQEKYFEAINSLMVFQEENLKLKEELKLLKESSNTSKLEENQLLLIEALDVNADLESKISELKKSKISLEIELKKEISRLQGTLSNINMLNMELVKSDAKCILCERSCSCHLVKPFRFICRPRSLLKKRKSDLKN